MDTCADCGCNISNKVKHIGKDCLMRCDDCHTRPADSVLVLARALEQANLVLAAAYDWSHDCQNVLAIDALYKAIVAHKALTGAGVVVQ